MLSVLLTNLANLCVAFQLGQINAEPFKWSGIPTMEYRMRKHKPGYLEYVASTSSFLPLPPKAQSTPNAQSHHE